MSETRFELILVLFLATVIWIVVNNEKLRDEGST